AMNHAGITSGCATCHAAGLKFGGTPVVVVMPTNHVPINGAACEACHAAATFTTFAGNSVTLMKHSAVTAPCATCHEKGGYIGTPAVVARPTAAQDPNHPLTGECGTCHSSTVSFTTGVTTLPTNHIPVGGIACAQCHANGNTGAKSGVMSHTGITTNCVSCHMASAAGKAFLGVTPMAMGTGHVPTTAACESCHKSTTAFGPGTAMNHAGITSGCATCHAAGKTFSGTPVVVVMPTTHVPIGSATCESCHAASNFTTFSGNSVTLMKHSAVTAPCATCHESTTPTWIGTPAVVKRPTAAQDPNHPATGECGTCHTSTVSFTTGITGMPSGHIPTSAACTQCHANGNTGPKSGVMNHTGITTNCVSCHAASATGT
ncbi:MAG: cytochrome c3 family protein, partial [Gaiellaceae bacterium]